MTIFQAIILGIVQGLTEFLPISSSAHLVLLPYFTGWNFPQEQIFPFDVLVQWGTLLAVILYFRHDLIDILSAWVEGLIKRKPFENQKSRLGWLIILGTIPAGVFGLLLKPLVEKAFQTPAAIGFLLLVTMILLLIAEFVGKRQHNLEQVTWLDALVIGCFQAISVFPGISRSGSTISGGLIRNLERKTAARFSFLLSIPIMLAAGLLEMKDLIGITGLGNFLPVVFVGIISAGIVGFLSIHWLLGFLSRNSLKVFAIYCGVIGLITILVWFLR
jgi:undecaprenyl-diphosphatase